MIPLFTDEPEEKRTYAQLEILYRARGRELEDITWQLEKQKDENAKEIRILKHKLAVATGKAYVSTRLGIFIYL